MNLSIIYSEELVGNECPQQNFILVFNTNFLHNFPNKKAAKISFNG